MSRFCSKCGNQLGDSQFCTKCGTRASDTSVSYGSTSGGDMRTPDAGMNYLIFMIISVVCTAMLFFKWLSIAGELEFNCFGFFFDMLDASEISDELSWLVFIGFIVLVLSCVIIGFTIRTCKAAVEKSDYTPSYCRATCGVSLALSVLVIVLMLILQAALESELGGFGSMVGELIELTAAPYILLVVSIIGIVTSKAADK